MTTQDVLIELKYDYGIGLGWWEVTDQVRIKDGVRIERGRKSESGSTPPMTMNLTFDDRGDSFNPQHPNSPMYGLIGMGTLIRLTVDGDIRFVGHITAFNLGRSLDGNDQWIEVEAAGLRRKLAAGNAPANNPMRGFTLDREELLDYWPLEVSPQHQGSYNSANGGTPLVGTGTIVPGVDNGCVGSDDTVRLDGGQFTGEIRKYTGTMSHTVTAVFKFPASGVLSDGQRIFQVSHEGSTIGAVSVRYRAVVGGGLYVTALDPAGNIISSTSGSFNVDGNTVQLRLYIRQSGGNIVSELHSRYYSGIFGSAAASQSISHTVAGTLGQPRGVTVGGDGATQLVVGHLAAFHNTGSMNTANDEYAFTAGWGEPAGDRYMRLAEQNQIEYSAIVDYTPDMGYQPSGTIAAIIDEAETTDGGFIYDSWVNSGSDSIPIIYFRPLQSLYSQDPALTVDFAAGEISPPFEVVYDDKELANTVTARASDGGEATTVITTGPLGVDQIGAYRRSHTLNLGETSHLGDASSWYAHLGTQQGPRFPSLTVDLAANPHLTAEAQDVRLGDALLAENLPGSTGDTKLIVWGWEEEVGTHTRTMTFNVSPAAPYEISVVGSTGAASAHVGADDTVIRSGGVTSIATTLQVEATTGTRWLFGTRRILVGGEEMGLTTPGAETVVGVARRYDFTVTRGVNGIQKAHPAGTPVELIPISYFGR